MDYIAAGSNVLLWKKVTWECFFAIIYLRVVRWNKHVYYLYSSVYRLRSTLFLYFQAYKYMLASQTHTHGNSRALPACEFLGHKFRKRFSFSAAMKRSAEEISLPIDEPETRRTLKHILLKSKWVLRNGHPYYHNNNNNDLYIYIHTYMRVLLMWIYYHKRLSPFLYIRFSPWRLRMIRVPWW